MNAYKILQVDPAADQEVIEAAYKRLAWKYHPDRNPGASFTEKMQRLNAAYEMVRDPDRRRRYDRERDVRRQRREQRERERESETRPSEPEFPADEVAEPEFPAQKVSHSLFRLVLWATALVALVVYFPWGAAILLAIWGATILAGRHPGVISKILKTGGTVIVTVGVAVGLYLWRQDQLAEKRQAQVQKELANISIDSLLEQELDVYVRSCVETATQHNPAIADSYCQCLVGSLRARFDNSSIQAESLAEFRSKFSARFGAAAPDDSSRAVCWSQAQRPPAVVPRATVGGMRRQPVSPRRQKPAEAGSTQSPSTNEETIDPAVLEALRPDDPPRPGSPNTTP